MVCYSTRVYGYTLLHHDTRYYLLLLELLHGFTFAGVWISSQDYVKEISPEGWITTMQYMLSGFYYMVGTALGSFIGGYEMMIIGYRSVYRYASYGIAGLFCLHLVISVCLCIFTD